MKPIPMPLTRYLEILKQLVPLGWMPIGPFGSMTFRKSDKTYDLSAADLSQLERIEQDGLFVISE